VVAGSSITALIHVNRSPEADECYTPLVAVRPIVPYIKGCVVFEPTSGKSKNIVRALEQLGVRAVIDVDEGYDFLTDTSGYENADVIVTNPPYSKKDAFLERCYAIGKPFALLLPVSALQGVRRGGMFMRYGIELLVLTRRVDFTGKGQPHFGVAWFCWRLLPEKLIFVDPDEEGNDGV